MATADNEIFGTSREIKETCGIHVTNITGIEPAILDPGGGIIDIASYSPQIPVGL